MVSYHEDPTCAHETTPAGPILCIQMRKTSNYGSVIMKLKQAAAMDELKDDVNDCIGEEYSVATTNSSGSASIGNIKSDSGDVGAIYDQLIALTKQDTCIYAQRDYIGRRNNRLKNAIHPEQQQHIKNHHENVVDEYDEPTESGDCNDFNIFNQNADDDDVLDPIQELKPSEVNNKTNDCDDVDPALVMDVDESCREKMCEWSYRICDHFHTSREIVAIAFNYLDRFNDCTRCDRTAFKLASMTCLYIATKVFHNKQLSVSTLVELSRNEFDAQHIIKMERIILSSLQYKMNPPTVQIFLHQYQYLVPLHQIVALVGQSDILVDHHNNLQKEKISAKVMNTIFDRAYYYSELVVYDYSLITEHRQSIAIACMFNAIYDMMTTNDKTCNEKTDYDYYCYDDYNDLQMQYEQFEHNFIAMLQTNVISMATKEELAAINMDRIHEIQERVWYLYSCSADYQQNHYHQSKQNHHHTHGGHFFYHQYQAPVTHPQVPGSQNNAAATAPNNTSASTKTNKKENDLVSGSSPISVLPTRARVTGLRSETFSVRIF